MQVVAVADGFPPDGEVVEPGNRRLVAVTLGTAFQRVVTDDLAFDAAMVIDGEPLALTVHGGRAEFRYRSLKDPDLVFETTYDALMALADGRMEQAEFFTDHSRLDVRIPGKEAEFAKVMSDVMVLLSD